MRKIKTGDIIWFSAFFAGFLLILYKCRFGFANIDEAFYLTIPYRLIQGDAMVLDEWNMGQISAPLIYPLLWMYLKITQSTEGVFLAFRYLYTIIHGCTAIFIYVQLREINWGAGFASILYLLFTPHGIMALSYNSMGIGLMVITCILLYKNTDNRNGTYLLAGLTFAGAVLCCPHLVFAYFIFGAVCAASRFSGSCFSDLNHCFLLKGYGWFTAGCAVAAGAFLAFVFSRCTLEQFWDVIPAILDDPEHTSKSMLHTFLRLFAETLRSNSVAVFVFPCALLLALAAQWDKKRGGEHEKVTLIVAALLAVLYAIPFLITRSYTNFLMFPLAILGFFLYQYRGKRFTREFVFLWIPGVLYAFCINWSSNQGFYVIANAMFLSTLGSILMMASYCQELAQKEGSGGIRQGCVGLLACFILCTAALRYDNLYWETGGMSNMTHEFQQGCQKGIIASPVQGKRYDNLYQRTAMVRNHLSEKVLYYTLDGWLYLDDQKVSASYSSWFPINEHSERKLLAYYEKNPSKIPDIIYSEKETWESAQYVPEFFAQRGYQIAEADGAYMITCP